MWKPSLPAMDPSHANDYAKNFKTFDAQITKQIPEWKKRVVLSKVKSVITYHKTLNYFLAAFGLAHADSIEPKPGIPPTPRHILNLQQKIKSQLISCLWVESFFETDSATKLSKDTGIPFFVVPTEVDSTPEASNYLKLIETLVSTVEKCAKK